MAPTRFARRSSRCGWSRRGYPALPCAGGRRWSTRHAAERRVRRRRVARVSRQRPPRAPARTGAARSDGTPRVGRREAGDHRGPAGALPVRRRVRTRPETRRCPAVGATGGDGCWRRVARAARHRPRGRLAGSERDRTGCPSGRARTAATRIAPTRADGPRASRGSSSTSCPSTVRRRPRPPRPPREEEPLHATRLCSRRTPRLRRPPVVVRPPLA
jgi:hypothetical protein